MLFIVLLGLGVVCISSVSAERTTVVMCGSLSCAYNKRARCTRRKVAIYDNRVIGLCLYHSESMSKRILEPMSKVAERGKPNPQMITKIMQAQEKARDSELLKNPKAFARWMKKQGIGKNRR